MREVEVKIQITNANQVAAKLAAGGFELCEPIVQRDIVYIPNEVPTVPCPAGTNVLRIRKQGGKTLFTLKRSDAGNHLSKLEHELEIGNGEEMGKIIKLLGFKIIADTIKTRRVCHAGEYELCVDSVKGLGDFVEIEKISGDDPKRIQEDMMKFLSDLEVTGEQVHVGYDILYVQKYGNATV